MPRPLSAASLVLKDTALYEKNNSCTTDPSGKIRGKSPVYISGIYFAFISVIRSVKTIQIMAKYSKKAGETVEKAVEKMEEGKLKSGKSGKKVTSRKQAVAIGLSEAREKGYKVPEKKSGSGKDKSKKS